MNIVPYMSPTIPYKLLHDDNIYESFAFKMPKIKMSKPKLPAAKPGKPAKPAIPAKPAKPAGKPDADPPAKVDAKPPAKLSNSSKAKVAAGVLAVGGLAVAIGMTADEIYKDKNNVDLSISKIKIIDENKPGELEVTFSIGIKSKFTKEDKLKFTDKTLLFPSFILNNKLDIIDIVSKNKILNIKLPKALETTKTLGSIIVNDKELTIISMETQSNNILVTYKEKQKILITDKISYKDNSNIIEIITINKIISDTEINVTIPKLGTNDMLGIINLKGSDDIGTLLKESASEVGDKASNTAKSAWDGATSPFKTAGNFIGNMLKNTFRKVMFAIGIFVIIFIIIIFNKIIFKKKKES